MGGGGLNTTSQNVPKEPVRQEVSHLKEQDSRWIMHKHMFK